MSNPATDDQTISVIYVDDEPSLLEIGRLFLQKSGTFTVTTAESADEAIQTLKKQSFDAIISDYQMPGMDGIAFLKYLRKAGDTTPFIIFTGKGREDVVIEALNEGADFYLQKGGDPKSQFAELSNKVRYAVTRRQGEERLIESEERYRSLFNQSMEGIYLHDLEGRILDVNMMACMQSGYSREEWLTRTIFDGHPDTSRWNLPKNEILHAWS
jgi:DNA-binding response OmpR family regulator